MHFDKYRDTLPVFFRSLLSLEFLVLFMEMLVIPRLFLADTSEIKFTAAHP
jgi:hypothetical protein